MRINPGQLNKQITVQRYSVTQDEIGNEVSSWDDYLTVWAAVNDLYGQEYWAAAGQGQEDTVVFTTRWNPLLDALAAEKELTRYRLRYDGRMYDITGYDHMGYTRRIIKIKAVRKE